MPINRFANKPIAPTVKKRVIVQDLTFPRNTIIPKNALVISLPSAKKRLSATVQAYKATGFEAEIQTVIGVDGMKLKRTESITIPPGDYGCLLSHKKCIELAKENKWPCVLIIENDVTFIDGFSERLKKAMSELPENWDMLWLGGLPREQNEPYSESLDRMFGSWGTYGYVIRDTMYLTVLNILSQEKLIYSVDDYFGRIHGKHNSFRTRVNYIIHTGEKSDRKLINTKKADE